MMRITIDDEELRIDEDRCGTGHKSQRRRWRRLGAEVKESERGILGLEGREIRERLRALLIS